MAFSTKVGSITVPNATGNQGYTGVGFTPKLVFFFGNGQTADANTGNAGAAGAPFYGWAVSSASRVAMIESDDGATTNATSTDATKCIKRLTGATTSYAADLVSLDADGFTLNWTTANASAFVVNYLALGGADLANVSIVSFTSKASTGNQSYTGAGFAPTAVLFMGADNGASDNSFNFGCAKSSTARWAVSNAGNATTGGSYQVTTKCYANVDGSSSVRCEADLVSLDSDGFTLNWTTANATTHTVYALCLAGGQYGVGTITQKTSTGSQAYTGVGFQPTGAAYWTNTLAGGSGLVDGVLMLAVGAASSATARGTMEYQSGSSLVCALNRTKVYNVTDDSTSATVLGQADITSFDADGWTWNFGTADATARQITYLAFGSTGGGGGGDTLWAASCM